MIVFEPLEQLLRQRGFTLQPVTKLDTIVGTCTYKLPMHERLPKHAVHFQGTLDLEVTLHGREDFFDVQLGGVHPMGYGYQVSVQMVPFSDVETTVEANFDKFVAMLTTSWVASCPAAQ